MTSDEFTGTGTTGISFFIPWGEVVVFVVVAYVFSLLLTWWPSRGATKVPVAEALRFVTSVRRPGVRMPHCSDPRE